MKERKLVYGFGVNDADYTVKTLTTIGYKPNGRPIQKPLWTCPFYSRWRDMIRRCYSELELIKHPNYRGCSVDEQWSHLTIFKPWMETQDWQSKHLDKDLLIPNNKVYSPETCCFIDQTLNVFITDRRATKTDYLMGVSLTSVKGCTKFRARCNNTFTGKNEHLGLFDTQEEAHQTWLTEKLRQAKILASLQTDRRVADALVDRYENYAIYFGA